MDLWTAYRDDGTEYEMGEGSPALVLGFEPAKIPDLDRNDNGIDVERSRPMTLRLFFDDQDRASVQDEYETLTAFWQPGLPEFQLVAELEGEAERCWWVRSLGVDDPTEDDERYAVNVQVRLRATPAHRFGPEDTETIGSTPEVVAIGGKRRSSAWVLEVEGACVNPRVTLTDADGQEFWVQVNDTIASGETLHLDARADMAKVWTGSAWRYPLNLSGPGVAQLFPIGPGNTTASFTRTSGASTAVLRWRPAF